MLEYNLSHESLQEILNYFGLRKMVGTKLISYWSLSTNRNFLEPKIYDKNSPFYILKKLQ